MKNIGSVILIAISTLTAAHAQSKKTGLPTPEVAESFKKSFPKASSVKWEKEKGGFEANFKEGGKEMSAVFNEKAILTETETTVKTSELPPAAQEYIKQNYKNSKIDEAARIVLASGDTVYEAEVNKKDLIFDSKGKFLRKE